MSTYLEQPTAPTHMCTLWSAVSSSNQGVCGVTRSWGRRAERVRVRVAPPPVGNQSFFSTQRLPAPASPTLLRQSEYPQDPNTSDWSVEICTMQQNEGAFDSIWTGIPGKGFWALGEWLAALPIQNGERRQYFHKYGWKSH